MALLTVAIGLVGLFAVASYGYVRYQFDQVAKLPCRACVNVAAGKPYNILIIGSDSRAGDTGQAASSFGSASTVGGQRSDTIKILRIDPAAGTAKVMSIPRDTYVTTSGLAPDSGLTGPEKINAAFNNGPEALIETIQNTFGIPISHYIVINFFGVMDAVNALGGISLDFPYPARDQDCSTGVCYNNSGLNIPTAGCQVLNGSQALSLSRSRYYQYYTDGYWHSDPTSDLGRIERQNLVISAAMDKAKSTYDPLKLNSLLSSVVHDFSKDNDLSAGDLFALAERYHALSGSSVPAYVLPTEGAVSSYAGDVEVVQAGAASAMISQFLGGPLGTITTPPIDQYGNALTLSTPTTTTTAPVATTTAPASSTGTTPAASTGTSAPNYDPTPC